jgi:hypothetical protein
MADVRASRRGLIASRTRKRNEKIRGVSDRTPTAEKERRRTEEGRTTLSEAFGGVPSKAQFLKTAHLFERDVGAVNRAYIVPGGLSVLQRGSEMYLYWYRRNMNVSPLAHLSSTTVTTKEGEEFHITSLEMTHAHVADLNGRKIKRSCTGASKFFVQ